MLPECATPDSERRLDACTNQQTPVFACLAATCLRSIPCGDSRCIQRIAGEPREGRFALEIPCSIQLSYGGE